eukprot:jgi/Botrbrau1/442/Bobra.110_2s0091.2
MSKSDGSEPSDGRAGLRSKEPYYDLNLTDVFSSILSDTDWLLINSATFWIKHGLDEQYGGFKGTVARDGKSIAPYEKGLISQSRYLWSLATLREHNEVGPEVDPLMASLYDFIVGNFLNTSNHLFYMRVAQDGSRLAETHNDDEEANIQSAGSQQWLYGQAFAIHALSTYARVANRTEAYDVAMRTFDAVDSRFHDSLHGGFNQKGDEGLYIDLPGNKKPSGELGLVQKTLNAHLQFVPAYTELYKTTKDPDVANRLYELINIIATKLPAADGSMASFYTRNWTALYNRTDTGAVPQVVIPVGLQLETTEYIFQAAEALRNSSEYSDAQVLAVKAALNNTAFTFEKGWDAENGGWYDTVDQDGNVVDDDHIWWVQNESLPTTYRLYSLTGDNRYLLMVRSTLKWIRDHQTDHEYGEQYWGVLPNGQVDDRGTVKGEFWKANYHVTHGLLGLKKLVPY